jgi:soluble lytic murein transglycosylase
MIKYKQLGIFLSKPIALLFVLVYLVQSAFIIYLALDKFRLHREIEFQQKRIAELEEKLKILQVIEDFQIGFNDREKGELANVIFSECQKYDYDPLFLISLILTESSFRRHQVSEKGARGLMQILPSTGRVLAGKIGIDWEGDKTLHESDLNIQIGSRYLFEQILKFKDVHKALISYNLGETELMNRMRLNEPLPRYFLNKVMNNYNMLKEKYKS